MNVMAIACICKLKSTSVWTPNRNATLAANHVSEEKSGLAAGTMSSSSVPLTWTASTDNVGVAGYRVYRDGTLVNTVTGSPPATSFTDTTVGPAKTYVYQVLAYDAAGNASDLGTGLSVTTPNSGSPN